MSTLLLILWGCLWTAIFSVGAQLFHVGSIVIHVPIALAVYCAARRRPLETWLVTWVVGWWSVLLGGGGRGPALLALFAICGLLVFSRRRLKLQSNARLVGTVIAVCVAWSGIFILITEIVGGPSFWHEFLFITPMSAAITGAFSFVNVKVLSVIDPDHSSGNQDGPQPLRPR